MAVVVAAGTLVAPGVARAQDSCTSSAVTGVIEDPAVPGLFDQMNDSNYHQVAADIMHRSGPLPAAIADTSTFGQWLDMLWGTRPAPEILQTAYHESIHVMQASLEPVGGACVITSPSGGILADTTPSVGGSTGSGFPRTDVLDPVQAAIDRTISADDVRSNYHCTAAVYLAPQSAEPCHVGGSELQGFESLLKELNAYGHENELGAAWKAVGVKEIYQNGDTTTQISLFNDSVTVIMAATKAYLTLARAQYPDVWNALRAAGHADALAEAWNLVTAHWKVRCTPNGCDAGQWDLAFGDDLEVIRAFTNGGAPPTGYPTACDRTDSAPGAFADAGLAADCLKAYGIALGKDDGTFGENDPLLRSQVSSLLVRLLEISGVPLSATRTFPDVNADTVPNTQVRHEIELLAGSGVIAGFPDGTFGPASKLSVAQAATFVIRTLQLIHAQRPTSPVFTDQGTTTANDEYAIQTGILDRAAANLSGVVYDSTATATTARGLLADFLAQSLEQLGKIYYATCTEAQNAGAAPMHPGDPGYRPALDPNNTGTACG